MWQDVVLDAAPFLDPSYIIPTTLSPKGEAAAFFTIPEVLAEVKDEGSKARLDAFRAVHTLAVQQPTPEAVKTVIQFAKRSGDFQVLSRTDIRLLALAVTRMQSNGIQLRAMPAQPRVYQGTPASSSSSVTSSTQSIGSTTTATTTAETQHGEQSVAPKRKRTRRRKKTVPPACMPEEPVQPLAPLLAQRRGSLLERISECTEEEEAAAAATTATAADEEEDAIETEEEESESLESTFGALQITESEEASGDVLSPAPQAGEDDEMDAGVLQEFGGAEKEDEEGFETVSHRKQKRRTTQRQLKDEEGWVTPMNIASVRRKHASTKTAPKAKEADLPIEAEEDRKQIVAVMTGDFAMQNILMQLGALVLAKDGHRITQIKQFVLRCHACTKITKAMDKQFCPSCGNPTLLRTSCSVNEDGSLQIYLKKGFQYHLRGTKFNVGKTQGGPQAAVPILREDQKEYEQAARIAARVRKDMMQAEEDPSLFGGEHYRGKMYAQKGIQGKVNMKTGRVIVGSGSRDPNRRKHKV